MIYTLTPNPSLDYVVNVKNFTQGKVNRTASENLYAGGNAEGYIVGKVRVDDQNPKVVYGLNYDGSGGIWFALQ